MALTLVTQYAAPRANVEGATVEVFQDVQFDSSYPTGGYALTPAQVGLTEIIYLDCGSLTGYIAHYDYANQKLLLYTSGGTQVTAATNLSTVFGRLLVVGKGFPSQGLK